MRVCMLLCIYILHLRHKFIKGDVCVSGILNGVSVVLLSSQKPDMRM